MLGQVRCFSRARRAVVVATAGVLSAVFVASGVPSAAADTYWSPWVGSHSVGGAILGEYRVVGGPEGRLGYPVTDELPTPRAGGRFNHFEHGSIYWAPGLGAHEMFGAIRGKWASLGWENSMLGFPVTDEFPVGHGGVAQNFTGGSIYWSAPTGAHSVIGAIRQHWGELNWDQGYLGLPVTDEISLGRRGAYQLFQGGAVYWSPGTGAHAIRGAIAARWAGTGWENGPLGFPVSDENPLPGGASSHFQGGTISWSADTGAHVVTGAIRDLWAGMGWEGSVLGYPVTDEYSVPGGRQSDFEYGSILWTPELGAAPDVWIDGTGSGSVPLFLGSSRMLVEVSGEPTRNNLEVRFPTDRPDVDLALLSASWDTDWAAQGTVNWTRWPLPVTGFEVDSESDWSVHLSPAAWAPTLGRNQLLSGTGRAFLHYVGPPGALRVTSDGFMAVSSSNRADGPWPVVRINSGPATATGAVAQDVYLSIDSYDSWTIEVL